jgi:hypothetical protein
MMKRLDRLFDGVAQGVGLTAGVLLALYVFTVLK